MWFHLYEVPKVKFTDPESRVVVARGWKEAGMKACAMSTLSVFFKMKTVLELGYVTMQYTLLNCALTNGQDGKFYVMYIIYNQLFRRIF